MTLSKRYLPDRFLPDKAIDLVDEAAAGVRMTRARLPRGRWKKRAAAAAREKEAAISAQEYEKAAGLRDAEEASARRRRRSGKKQICEAKNMKIRVTAEDIAAVLSNWTGIPVTRLNEREAQDCWRWRRRFMRALWGRTRRCALWRVPSVGAESASKIRGGRSGRSSSSGRRAWAKQS